MKFLSYLKEHRTETVVGVVAAALPAYGLRFHIGPFPTTVLEVVLLVAIATLIITHPTLSYNKRGGDKLLITGSVLIFLATIIGIIVAPNKIAALGIARAYFWEPMILAWLIIASKPDKDKIWRAAVYGFALNAVVIVGYAIFQYIFPQFIPATYFADRRVTSFYSFPNAIALYLAPLTPVFLSLPITIPLALLSVLAVILAQSAGGLVAVAAAIFFLGIAKKRTRILTIAIALAVALIVALAPQAVGLRDQILMRDWSGRVHKIGWEESFAMLKDHPLFGAGISGYQTAVAPYHNAQGVEVFQYPHNLFLATWSEIGLMGLMGLILVLIWFFKKTFRRYSLLPTPYSLKFLAAAMVAILVHGLVDVPYFKNDLAAMFWLLVALVAL